MAEPVYRTVRLAVALPPGENARLNVAFNALLETDPTLTAATVALMYRAAAVGWRACRDFHNEIARREVEQAMDGRVYAFVESRTPDEPAGIGTRRRA